MTESYCAVNAAVWVVKLASKLRDAGVEISSFGLVLRQIHVQRAGRGIGQVGQIGIEIVGKAGPPRVLKKIHDGRRV